MNNDCRELLLTTDLRIRDIAMGIGVKLLYSFII